MAYELPVHLDPSWDAPFRAAWAEVTDKLGALAGYGVKEYGAVGDGSADDTIPLQDVIDDAASNGGGVVQLPPGNFKVTAKLEYRNKVSVVGSGQDVTFITMADGANQYIAEFTEETRGVFFTDLTIDGGAQTTNGGGIIANGAVECRFTRVHFTNCFNWGLILGPNADDSFGHNNSVFNCWFDSGMYQAGYGSGILTTSNDENWIMANDFVYMGGASTPPEADGPCCIFDRSGLNYYALNNFVNGDNSVKGIHSKDMTGIRMIGNNFDGLAGDGIDLSGSRHIIMGNYVSEPAKESPVRACGIKLGYGIKQTVVTGNVLKTGASGTDSLLKITGDGDPTDLVVTGNVLDGTDGSPFTGLYDIATTVKNCVVRDNVGISTSGSTAERPDATKLPAGVSFYDTSLWQTITTDDAGQWRDAMGTVV